MPTTTVNFVRHGEVYNPRHVLYERLPGFHLSDQGKEMVKASASFIAHDEGMRAATALYSSPLDRTRETAEIIEATVDPVREALGLQDFQINFDPRLIEAGNEFRGTRIGYGKGALWRRRNIVLLRNMRRPSWGETYQQIAARVKDFTFEKVQEHPDQQIIVVSHESPIWTFRHLMETGHPEHNMLRRNTDLASITSLTFDSDTCALLGVSYVSPAAGMIR
ncbi:histidine phosphatase family protein [Bifidobacterium aquikefiricola]|uniref:Histidine phosphatase family protein n=1 Tax=Bifidobacterium aquikefiricola TaxID=3059038 RepID=A0AB39U695_9BIFI